MSFSHSVCVCTMPAVVSSMLPCHTDTISLSATTRDRVATCLDLGGTGERQAVFLFACDTLFPFTSKLLLQRCLWGTCCSSGLELPWLLGLGSCTALIQFTTQLHNCSQSPVDLDVKRRSSCTSPEKGGGISGRPLRTF